MTGDLWKREKSPFCSAERETVKKITNCNFIKIYKVDIKVIMEDTWEETPLFMLGQYG